MHISKDTGLLLFAFSFVLHLGHCGFDGESLDTLIFLRYHWQIQSPTHGHDYLSLSNFILFLFVPLVSYDSKQYVKSVLFLKGLSWKSKAILQSLIIVTFKDIKSEGVMQ